MGRSIQSVIRQQTRRGKANATKLGLQSGGRRFIATRRDMASGKVRRAADAAGAPHVTMEMVTEPFQKAIQDLVETMLPDAAAKAVRAVVLKILAATIRRTPVDTGLARASWQFAMTKFQGGSVPGRHAFVVRKKIEVKNELTLAHARKTGKVAAEITNNLEYILPLEFGWSGQAPLGMLRLSVAEATGLGPKEMAKLFKADWLEAMLKAETLARPMARRFAKTASKRGAIKQAGLVRR